MESVDYYINVEIPYHEPFNVMVRHQVVRECSVNRRWMIGTPWSVVDKWLKRHKSKITVVKKQMYLI